MFDVKPKTAAPAVEKSSRETDDSKFLQRTCFVIMPFGEKVDTGKFAVDALGKAAGGLAPVQVLPGAEVPLIDFDKIYEMIIKPAVEAASKDHIKISCERSDKAGRSGHIHRDMIESIVMADIAIVDITTQNANVFYELGVRHSYCRATTILIRREGTHIPFNISGMRVFAYDDDVQVKPGEQLSPLQKSVAHLADIIRASERQKETDSLVHHMVPHTSVVRQSWPIMERKTYWSDILDRSGNRILSNAKDGSGTTRSVGFITGDIMQIKDIDVWVNPENTKMQMARFHDGSISSNIRYFGAKRSRGGRVLEDTVNDALCRCMGDTASVEPGVVIPTGPGELARTNGVKVLLHVAAMHGEPGKGYQPIRDYPACVLRVLAEIDRLNAQIGDTPRRSLFGGRREIVAEDAAVCGLDCRSVIFPLFGTRSFGQHPQTIAEKLYEAAIVYLEQHGDSRIEDVFFLAYTQQDRELCERALGLFQTKKRLKRSDEQQET